jgi:hypothetical protein
VVRHNSGVDPSVGPGVPTPDSTDTGGLRDHGRGKLSVASGAEKTRGWDLDSGQAVAAFAGQHHRIRGVAFSPDGTRPASASDWLWGGQEYDLHVRDTQTWAAGAVHVPGVLAGRRGWRAGRFTPSRWARRPSRERPGFLRSGHRLAMNLLGLHRSPGGVVVSDPAGEWHGGRWARLLGEVRCGHPVHAVEGGRVGVRSLLVLWLTPTPLPGGGRPTG